MAPHAGGSDRRDALRAVAAETVSILETGRYRSPGGFEVDLTGALRLQASGTVLYPAGEPVPSAGDILAKRPSVRVLARDAVTAILDGRDAEEPPCCLVFASARNPGGGFANGADAQEESLARSSTLVRSLWDSGDFYERHRADTDLAYSDAVIYTPHARLIRDAAGTLLDSPVPCAFVTAAAPNLAAMRGNGRGDPATVPGILARRAGVVLDVAAAHGHARLLLGAWGCGVFGNAPGIVARAFATALSTRPWFAEVEFAVPGGGSPNHAAFAKAFGAS